MYLVWVYVWPVALPSLALEEDSQKLLKLEMCALFTSLDHIWIASPVYPTCYDELALNPQTQR